ncbi:hypothetical protein GW916_09050 [bacterium]|nr:hypothetical protein [bacterium]
MKSIKFTGESPLEWGRQHGESLKTEIFELNEIRQSLLRKYLASWDSSKISTLCLAHLKTLESKYSNLYQEVLGVHQSSGLPLEDLMIVNAYTDLRDFSYGESNRVEDGCSIMAIKSENANWVAQTWDMHASATPYTVLLDYPEVPELELKSQKVLSVAGCLGLAGINHFGVSVMINNMHCKEFQTTGLIWTGLVRELLNQESAAIALEHLRSNLPSSGHNYMICDAKHALNVETTGKRLEVTSEISQDKGGHYFHTNHYLGSLANSEIMERQSPTTHKRYKVLEKYFSETDWQNAKAEQLQKDFFESGEVCSTICIPPSAKDANAGATCGGLIVDYKARVATGFKGLLNDGDTVSIRF